MGKKIRLLRVAGAAVVCMVVLSFAALSVMAKRPANLGVTDGKLAPCPASPNCVCTQSDDALHRIEPLPLKGAPEVAVGQLKAIIARLPRMKIVEETPEYLHVEATSLVFRFVDDVEFYCDAASGVIHFRSASRVGYSDFGVNRKRMEQIRREYLKLSGA
jgi:uncharacterized protein (DUF1499 family)